eukprot:COSAG01_NODE_2348_length_7857_cov_4.460299_12_plen_224_part_00
MSSSECSGGRWVAPRGQGGHTHRRWWLLEPVRGERAEVTQRPHPASRLPLGRPHAITSAAHPRLRRVAKAQRRGAPAAVCAEPPQHHKPRVWRPCKGIGGDLRRVERPAWRMHASATSDQPPATSRCRQRFPVGKPLFHAQQACGRGSGLTAAGRRAVPPVAPASRGAAAAPRGRAGKTGGGATAARSWRTAATAAGPAATTVGGWCQSVSQSASQDARTLRG